LDDLFLGMVVDVLKLLVLHLLQLWLDVLALDCGYKGVAQFLLVDH